MFCCFGTNAVAEQTNATQSISYTRDISPILQRNCVACHRTKQAEGGLSLETHQAIASGGDSGSLVVANHPDASLLFLRATDDVEPMPPDDNTVGAKRLTQEELSLIRTWISQGANLDGMSVDDTIDWQPIPESIRSSYALATSPNNRHLAIGHANRVEFVDAASGQVETVLVDENLPQSGTADLDVVQAIAFSPSGDRIATGGFRTVRIWKRENTQPAVPPAFRRSCGPTALSPDRSSVAIVNSIGDIEVWDIDGQGSRYTIPSVGVVTDIDWSSAERILVGYQSGDISVHATADGTATKQLSLDHPVVTVVQTGQDDFIASLGTDGRVRLFKGGQPHPSQALASIQEVTSIAFLADGTLVVGTASGVAKLADLRSDRILRDLTHGSRIGALTCNGTCKVIATGGIDGITKLWNVDDGKLLQTLSGDADSQQRIAALEQDIRREQSWIQTLEGKTKELNQLLEKETAAFAKVTEAHEKATKELESAKTAKAAVIEKGEDPAGIEKEVEKKTAEATQREQAWNTAKKALDRVSESLPKHHDKLRKLNNRLVDLKHRLAMLTDHISHHSAVSSISFADGDAAVFVVDVEGRVRSYQVVDGKPLDRHSLPSATEYGDIGTTYFLDAHRMVIHHDSGPPSMIDRRQRWVLERTIGGPGSDLISDRVASLDFRGDGQSIAIGSGTPSRQGQVLIVATSTGDVMRQFNDLHSDSVLCVRFSPDGRRLATASADKTIRLIDVSSKEIVGALDGHTHHVLSLAWKEDGRTIASGSADSTIKVWDAETGQQRRSISGFGDEVTAVEFLADGSRVASACADGRVRVHDTNNGGSIATASAPNDFLFTIGISADANCVFATGQTGIVHQWHTEGLQPAGQ
ncbi:WD40 repeat domain-containing protein [Neorhodopirellula pilleata]|nr:c-type cytochrome domain-containing protein [Neorhodopirellula pilleata]